MRWRLKMLKICGMRPPQEVLYTLWRFGGSRRWHFFTLAASIILLFLLVLLEFSSLLYSRISIQPRHLDDVQEVDLLQKYGILYNKTIFGETLLPTPWQQMHSPLEPNLYKLKRAFQILNCSKLQVDDKLIHPHSKSMLSSTTIKSNNTTTFKEICPSYFHWIKRDLSPWKELGIRYTNLEMAKEGSATKVVIFKGRLYIDLYYGCFQTRLLFTLWGMLMLLRKYEGQVPDVEFMFNCNDQPNINKVEGNKSGGILSPPLLFSYCSSSQHYDIPWPDWSFWGWSELQLESWDQELDKITRTSQKQNWWKKIKKAYWTGNPYVGAPVRMEIIKCNHTSQSSKVDIKIQDWKKEIFVAKKNSKLEDQCKHRYAIYAEGVGWSVSLKYIMACGSPTLAISPNYYDFYMRGLQPWIHYIPVRPSELGATRLCLAIDEEVNRAELNELKALGIGKAGQLFMEREVGMENVYNYMFHLLQEYSALQTFQPSIPQNAHIIDEDYLLCLAQPLQKLLLKQARKLLPISVGSCTLSKPSKESFKDFGWEAKQHMNRSSFFLTKLCTITVLATCLVSILYYAKNYRRKGIVNNVG